IQCPSIVRFGAASLNALLMFGTGTGSFHAPSTVSRCETQMSMPPGPPGRLVLMYRLNPSFDIDGCWGLYPAAFITVPKFCGTVHGPNCWAPAIPADSRITVDSTPSRPVHFLNLQ